MVASLPAVVPLLLVQLAGLDGLRTHQLRWEGLDSISGLPKALSKGHSD
jgi:hypothetical protein